MKKLLMITLSLITLSLLLFTFLISPVQAKRPGPLDSPLPDYNNLTLRQIFEDGQLVNNPNFDTNYTGWTTFTIGSPVVIDGIVRYTATAVNGRLEQQFISNNSGANDIFYSVARYKTNSVNNLFYINDGTAQWFVRHSGSGNFEIISSKQQMTAGATKVLIKIQDQRTSAWTETQIDYIYSYNLTDLGISTATKIEMDNLYSDYLKYKNMMNATDVMLIVGQLGAFVWSLVVSFEIFGFVLWEYALFGIGAGFIGYLALKIIQKKAGDDNGDSD